MDREVLVKSLRQIVDKSGTKFFDKKKMLVSAYKDIWGILGADKSELKHILGIINDTDVFAYLLEGMQKPDERIRLQSLIIRELEEERLMSPENARYFLESFCQALSWEVVFAKAETNLKEKTSTVQAGINTTGSMAKIGVVSTIGTTTQIGVAPTIGSSITFGQYDWRVLAVENGKALLLSKDITHAGMSYHKDYVDVTWEKCTLRKWLNEDFYRSFGRQEQSRIALTTNVNENNQWYGTAGGNDTQDNIFLLSISEVVKYFGDSGQLKNKNPNWIDDQYNSARIAAYNGSPTWWWLRSPGLRSGCAARVSPDGDVDLFGYFVYFSSGGGGVRPALWLNL